jgi:HEAT repeat protein
MTRTTWWGLALAGSLLAAFPAVAATKTEDLLSKIDTLASLGKKAQGSLYDAVAEGIEEYPAAVSKAMLAKLADDKVADEQRVVYVWALGLTKDQAATDALIALYRRSKSETVQHGCLGALGTVGGQRAGAFLLSILDTVPNKETRFELLNLLGQVQYEPALPKMEEILKQDARQFYWQPIFVFGKMGDKAVPVLLKRLNDKDRNVRINAISVLGQWLIPPEAAKPLEDQYRTEQDNEIRHLILSSLERTIADLERMKVFFEAVVAKENNAELKKFAGETVANVGRIKAKVVSEAVPKKGSPADFAQEYARLFKSAGHKGDYAVLAASSSAKDEPKLKALRERILQRNSDEAFYDYQKVNNIIIHNRFAESLKNAKEPEGPTNAGEKE